MDLDRLAGHLKSGFRRKTLTGHSMGARGCEATVVEQSHPAGSSASSLYLIEPPEQLELDVLMF